MKVTRHEPAKPAPTYDILGLTEVQAHALATVLARVGGSPEKTYRRATAEILDGLESAGVEWSRLNDILDGSVTFITVEDPSVFPQEKF